MAIAQAQKQGFEERLSRIKKGGANTMGEVHIGPRDEDRAKKGAAPNTVRLKRKKNSVKLGEGSNSVLVPLAMILGALSMFVGQAAAFHLFQEGGLFPVQIPVAALQGVLPFAHFAFAGVLALMFAWTFGFSNLVRKLAVVAGLAAMFYFQADLIQKYPGIYANFFSEAYVAQALSPV